MKTYQIPVCFSMYGTVTVQAVDLDDAIAKVEDGPLPTDASYLEGSFEIDHAVVEDTYGNEN